MTRSRRGRWPWQGEGRGRAPKTDGGAVQRAAVLHAVVVASAQFRHAGDADVLALRRRRSAPPLMAGTSAFPVPSDLAGLADRHAGLAGPARLASPLLRAPPVHSPGKAYRPRSDFGVWGTPPKLDEGGRPPPGIRRPARPGFAPALGCNDRMRALAGFLAVHKRRPCRAKPPTRRLRRASGRGPRRQGPRRPRPARHAGRGALPKTDAQGRGVPPCAPSRPLRPLHVGRPLARQARRRRGERNGGPGRFR